MLTRLTLPLMLLAAVNLAAAQADLLPGDKAPEVKAQAWVKGKEITKIPAGKIHVIEFWATWCGPCKTSIPHLTELAKKHKGKVEFAGISVWEDGDDIKGQVEKIVAGMGDKMGYSVAVDDEAGTVAKAWMEASSSRGIPTAFIVDKSGTVAWIGHPMELDKPLEAVIAGKHDVAAARTAYLAELDKQAKADAMQARIEAALKQYMAGQKTEALAELDKIAAESLDAKPDVMTVKLRLFLLDDQDKAKALVIESAKDEKLRMALAIFSISTALDKDGDLPFACFVSDTTVAALTKDEPFVLFYCSVAFSRSKDHKKSAALLERALVAFDKSEYAKDPTMAEARKEIASALKEEKAAGGQ